MDSSATNTDSTLAALDTLNWQEILAKQEAMLRFEHFSDILAHQQMLFETQTAYFIGFVGVVIAVGGLVSWRFLNSIQNKLDELSQLKTTVESLSRGLEDTKIRNESLEVQVMRTHRQALRALFEGSKGSVGKTIWQLRYCEAFLEERQFEAMNIHLERAANRIREMKEKHPAEWSKFLSHDAKPGLERIVQRILQTDYEPSKANAAFILNEIIA